MIVINPKVWARWKVHGKVILLTLACDWPYETEIEEFDLLAIVEPVKICELK